MTSTGTCGSSNTFGSRSSPPRSRPAVSRAASVAPREATDFLRGDVVIKGGITGLMKIAHLAEAHGMNCEVHDAYNSMNNVASLHVIMAISNCDWFEVLTFNRPASTTSST